MCIAGVVQPVFLMMHLSRSKQCWQSFRLLCAVCLCCGFLTAAGVAAEADERSDSRERFIELDGEMQAIKEEILEINQDILLLEELLLYPHGQQLVVLVSVANNSPVRPDSISLQLDEQLVSQHGYSSSEGAALQDGGVHRLYSGRLNDGEHSLTVSVTGKQAKGRAFHQQRSVTITKVPGRKYMELHLGPGENTPEPVLTIREW
jgi:hypothetical protein